ncbi:MAG: uroporphyrinogen decarboxylase [Cytophagaceae bacterium]|jgi:uroporphyrinogen decarboxylase|nr:uroporphyrinogen decarboxylase [Cytophagaceae bacterium]
MKYQNDILIRAARGEETERTPVWLMRQAGRVLPEYRAVREKLSGFIELCTTPELAAEVTIQPVDILGVDAAIIFSDILVIPEAMGLPYEMQEARGPYFPNVIQNKSDVDRLLAEEAADHLQYVYDAIDITFKELKGRVPLIGFAGAPFTILAYMIEGHGSKTFSKARRFLYNEPVVAHALLEKITRATTTYIKRQIDAGAALVQIFDSWAGILPPDQYKEFSLPYIKQICEDVPHVPRTVFSKGAFFIRDEFAQFPCETVGLDWNMDIQESRKMVGPNKVLQGNMDPCALYLPEDKIYQKTKEMLDAFGPNKHIANLGHGLYPDTEKSKVKFFVDAVKELSKR